MPGKSAGSFWPSPSRVASHSPRAAWAACQIDVLWPEDAPWFATLERDGAGVGLFVPSAEHPVSAGYAELYIDVTDARLMHAQVKDRVAIEWGPEVYSYGRREFALRDPDGYLVIFSEETTDPPTTTEP